MFQNKNKVPEFDTRYTLLQLESIIHIVQRQTPKTNDIVRNKFISHQIIKKVKPKQNSLSKKDDVETKTSFP